MNVRKIVKKIVPQTVFESIAPMGHLGEAIFWNCMYGFPGKGMKVIGITGTNGKTTTSFLVHKMLVEAGYNAGLMSTVAYGVGNDIQEQVEHMTSVGPRELMRRLKWMKSKNVDWVVLETTSHALAQHRVWGVPYSIAVMTNITHEHLDYHKTFQRYVAAKRHLFELTQANRDGLQLGIANADDSNGADFASVTENGMLYGTGENADVRATDIRLAPDHLKYVALADGERYEITCHLPGSFNVANSLAALCVGRAVGLSKTKIERGIAALKGVEGRMTTIDEGQEYSVIVDYAHTPDSFEKLFKDLRPVIKGRMIVMFGSAGRRDEAKRATQGELAGKYADEVILTEEDDRDIDGLEILDQIASGAEAAGKERNKDLFLVHNRTEAINFAVGRAGSKEDTVLLLGKGHEKDILRNGPKASELRHLQQDDRNRDRVVEFPWDEVGTAHDAVRMREQT